MKPLEEIITAYDDLRDVFKNFCSSGDNNKDSLLEFQHRFLELKADLRPWHTSMLKKSENRSDKQATAIKCRISISMVKGEFVFGDDKPMYDKPPTMSSAEKYAAATKEYKKFLDERTFYKESFVNIADLREDISAYVVLIRDKHNR
jgi:hypothetical protein